MVREQPEKKVLTDIRKALEANGWMVKKTHGSGYSRDWPDLFACHRVYGMRWIEIKKPKGRLSEGQISEYIKWARHGGEVWVLTGAHEIDKLKSPANFSKYLRLQRDNAL